MSAFIYFYLFKAILFLFSNEKLVQTFVENKIESNY